MSFPRTRGARAPSSGSRACRFQPSWAAAGADILTTVLVMEALGYGCHDNGLIFSLNAQMWSLELPLVKFGTPAQQQAYLPGLISGDLIGVHAMTEPDSGSDAFSMRTRVEREGDALRAQRDQAVHHQRPGLRRSAGLRRAPRQAQDGRHLRFSRREGDARVHRDPRPGQDGPADLADGRGRAGRLPLSRPRTAWGRRAPGWPSSTPR